MVSFVIYYSIFGRIFQFIIIRDKFEILICVIVNYDYE